MTIAECDARREQRDPGAWFGRALARTALNNVEVAAPAARSWATMTSRSTAPRLVPNHDATKPNVRQNKSKE